MAAKYGLSSIRPSVTRLGTARMQLARGLLMQSVAIHDRMLSPFAHSFTSLLS